MCKISQLVVFCLVNWSDNLLRERDALLLRVEQLAEENRQLRLQLKVQNSDLYLPLPPSLRHFTPIIMQKLRFLTQIHIPMASVNLLHLGHFFAKYRK